MNKTLKIVLKKYTKRVDYLRWVLWVLFVIYIGIDSGSLIAFLAFIVFMESESTTIYRRIDQELKELIMEILE
jgi:hypothetical protein